MDSVRNLKEKYVRANMDKWWRESNSINILVTGYTGVGKSSLLNTLLGKDWAAIGKELHPETVEVASFTSVIEGIKVTIWDSPGLQDGTDNEAAYLQDIEARCKDKIDLLLYCVSMTNARFIKGSRDIESMCKLTDKLGKGIWDNAVFVLTCANKYITATESNMRRSDDLNEKLKTNFYERLAMWNTAVKMHLSKTLHLSDKTVERLPILPTGRKGLPLLLEGYPDSQWQSRLWMESLLVTKHTAQPALIKLNFNRLVSSSDIRSEREFEELLSKEKIIIEARGTGIGRDMAADAERVGRDVGQSSGFVACMAHTIERIFSRVPNLKVLDTTITVDEDFGFIAAQLICKLHM